jgi:hypothetical protein
MSDRVVPVETAAVELTLPAPLQVGPVTVRSRDGSAQPRSRPGIGFDLLEVAP